MLKRLTFLPTPLTLTCNKGLGKYSNKLNLYDKFLCCRTKFNDDPGFKRNVKVPESADRVLSICKEGMLIVFTSARNVYIPPKKLIIATDSYL